MAILIHKRRECPSDFRTAAYTAIQFLEIIYAFFRVSTELFARYRGSSFLSVPFPARRGGVFCGYAISFRVDPIGSACHEPGIIGCAPPELQFSET